MKNGKKIDSSEFSMNYILLARELDNEARKSGYPNCPDDVIKEVLSFIGNIKSKSTCFYRIETRFIYDKTWIKFNEKTETKLINQTGYRNEYYCGCCHRFYSSAQSKKNHLKSKLHDKKFLIGDLGKMNRGEIIKRLMDYYRTSLIKNIRIKKVKYYEMWD